MGISGNNYQSETNFTKIWLALLGKYLAYGERDGG